ncbi:hypothetical protein A6A06_01840 [Streptomyces sp. CB02923]|uniref:type 2 lanthipeptide synthetase LanM family protein n=1 Tax=Streptomyces sp. CB02923 TaxID=1718985 RepID=UPI0009398121|nr:type 2 lanthipeptide synthetase LanM family protein [Streptomyces sp. CB02923]OKI09467.1 hypothetical protein A6A06_01840 [Streptomyces sp. CB02923]
MTVKRTVHLTGTDNAAYSYERLPPSGTTPSDEAKAAVVRWRESAFMSESAFRQRLARSGTTAEEFAVAITATDFAVLPEAMSWTAELSEVLARPAEAEDTPRFTTKMFAEVFPRLPFEGLLGSFLGYFEERLLAELADGPDVLTKLAGRLRADLLGALANRLLRVSARTLVLELNVARTEGVLEGGTPHERYDWYAGQILPATSYRQRLFTEYPVLGRSMIEAGNQWTAHIAELLRRLVADERLLRDAGLTTTSADSLAGLGLDLGDSHHRGRSVALLTFDDGTRLVYKPRSVATEAAYRALVDTVNAYGPPLENTGMRVLERDDYGWCEYIDHTPCATRRDIEDFYWRTGSTLAILMTVGAIDFHLENIIAAGPFPVPIDLETIFQQTAQPEGEVVTAHHKAMNTLFQGVLATGVLPARVFGDRRVEGVDLSAIGGGAITRTTRPVPTLVDSYQDTMRLEARLAQMSGAKNRPFGEGLEVRPEDHRERVVAGFHDTYEIIERHRDRFRHLLDDSADIEIRHLARLTRRYSLFLTESYHPDYLRNALDRERLLDKLWATAETRPDLIPLVDSEKRQLISGDVPCFRTRPAATEIHAPGYGPLGAFFEEPSLAGVRTKLDGFGEAHRQGQERIIRETLSTLLKGQRRPQWRPAPDAPEIGTQDAASLARGLATQLADRALLGTEDCSWLGVSLDGGREDSLTYRPVGTTLYDGLAGFAVTFGYAASLFQDDRYLDLARRCTVPMLDHLRDIRDNGIADTAGAFDGIAGLLYALDHMAHVTGEPDFAEHIESFVPVLRRAAEEEQSPDVIGGLAGCAVVAVNLHRRYGHRQLRDIAALCAQRLVETQVDVEGTAGWRPAEKSDPLGGFSHGSAGIAWALSELSAFLGSAELAELADRAAEFDRRLYLPEQRRWRDLRQDLDVGTKASLTASNWWCNGGVGVGMSRLLMLRAREDAVLRAEAGTALAETYAGEFGRNHSLCHGDLGNLELFTLAGDVLADAASPEPWRRAREEIAHGVLAQVKSAGAISGVPAGEIDVPGLMIGTAGVCLGLMRLAAPRQVPGVLWLESPDRLTQETTSGHRT